MIDIIKADELLVSELASFSARFFDEKWSEACFLNEIKKLNSAVFCAFCENEIVGVACVENQFGDGYLHNIAVADDYRRQGIAHQLMDKCFEFLQTNGLNKMFLEVRMSNTNAVNLYKKCGFETICIRKGFYTNPSEDAYSMVLEMK
ncbi:MAG: ribosomal protein S18-alanine N-acetyltransferase [Clostridia bacterium]|nr:ribosomal protein S18-alanine N-acetyltransferase [Clostridia bacterium]